MSTAVSDVKLSNVQTTDRMFGRPYLKSIVAAEVQSFARYYDQVIQVGLSEMQGDDVLNLGDRVDFCSISAGATTNLRLPAGFESRDKRGLVVLNGNLNHHLDVQAFLTELEEQMSPTARVAVVLYNPYLAGVYRLLAKLGLRHRPCPTTFFTEHEFRHLAKLAGMEIVKVRRAGYFPWKLFGLGQWINAIGPILPVLSKLSFAWISVLRSTRARTEFNPTLSVLIPARNERGNIENAIRRFPESLRTQSEILFIEGHSSDGTWEEIQRVAKIYSHTHKIKVFRQTGKGKGDAVKLGFQQATGDLLTVLDADLTMPPEQLPRFVEAYKKGMGEFINGNRLLYPYEGGSMRFLNWLGNVFFAKALSSVLGVRLGDSLCGTKLFSRMDLPRFQAWNDDFGKFDPFGDFEMIFPAATMGLGMVDLPIRYLNRTYGQTNIHRFRHGFMLLRMTVVGWWRLRTGRLPGGS